MKINPFKAILPARDKAYLVASRSYITYDEDALFSKLSTNPFTFLHVINPDYNSDLKLYGHERFEAVKEKFLSFIDQGILHTRETPIFCIYKQTKNGTSSIGLIGGADIQEYQSGKIKVHEKTLEKREKVFKEYLHITEMNAEPVLLFHRDHPKLKEIFHKYEQERPEFEFSSTNWVLHELWIVEDEHDVRALQNIYSEIEEMYIADGHHRCASSALLADEFPTEYNRSFMSFMVPESEMHIYEFNRLVKGLYEMDFEDIKSKLSYYFEITPIEEIPDQIEEKQFVIYAISGIWLLKVKEDLLKDFSQKLDVEIISKWILAPCFGIKDLRNDERVNFIGGPEAREQTISAVNHRFYDLAILTAPVKAEDIKRVADEGLTMPPKSTYIEPKLRSGMVVYPLNDF